VLRFACKATVSGFWLLLLLLLLLLMLLLRI
jgi:hypothetical protein